MIVAFECYADEDLVTFAQEALGLRLQTSHAGGQGEAINRLLERGTADVGLVDELDGATPPRVSAADTA